MPAIPSLLSLLSFTEVMVHIAYHLLMFFKVFFLHGELDSLCNLKKKRKKEKKEKTFFNFLKYTLQVLKKK